ncbi:MAG TPA: HAMP domain-containing sensor histidine kinase, partial [Flavisolibacter sp.]
DIQNRQLRDSIIADKVINSGYARKYDTRIYIFDSLNSPVNNDDPTTFAELNATFNLQSKKVSGNQDIFFHETSFEKFAYITKRIIQDTTGVLGTFFMISTPRNFGSQEALSAKLYRQANLNDPENSPNYSYAVYDRNILVLASTKYPFRTSLTPDLVPTVEFSRRENGDFDEMWYRPSNTKTVVVAKKRDSLLESMTLFSYLFCAFLFMVGLLELLALLFRVINERKPYNLFSQLNIRTQIHGTVIFISVLSFLVIGAATISFFIARYNRNNIDRLSRTAGTMVQEMEKRLKEGGSDSLSMNEPETRLRLHKLVNDVADIHNVDVNVYDLRGNLEVSSESEVYRQGALSTKMHPLAYYHLNNLREVQRVQRESINELDYLSIYTVVRDEQRQPKKYLNIPYFASQLDLNQEISNFLVTIINLNAFIFLIAGIIALFITNKITQSFSVIGAKMREITLGKTNEEIIWTKDDEIGELVKQYNKMVNELEKSAEALAKSEREGAWREMARQVAHEIKNPLTPMKLSIQYLQKAITDNKDNVKELTENVARTLIEQIDHLSKIAADFSQFANLSIRKTEQVDLHQVIGSLVELHKTNPRVDIRWDPMPGRMSVLADNTHMIRLFTNLLGNAVDACLSRNTCHINIREKRDGTDAIIMIQDNGEGIPEEMRSRIFTPNFTTKTSGTGLGLAMCKSIVEQSHGDIWFETETSKGTTFFVRLPLA